MLKITSKLSKNAPAATVAGSFLEMQFSECLVSAVCGNADLEDVFSNSRDEPIGILHGAISSALKTYSIELKLTNDAFAFLKDEKNGASSQKKPLRDAFAELMAPKEVHYLSFSETVGDENLQEQVSSMLKQCCFKHEIGCCGEHSKKALQKIINATRDALCFIHKHWRGLIHKPFPVLPDSEVADCELLQNLAHCRRLKR